MKNFLRFVVYGAGMYLGMEVARKSIAVASDPVTKAKIKRKIKETLSTD